VHEVNRGANRKLTALYWLGFFLLVLGATLSANFIARQVRESEQGHTYYEFIGAGVVAALVGIAIMVPARRRARASGAEPPAAPDGGGTSASQSS
jgi:membrane protein DedA with SNARE-associated domain